MRLLLIMMAAILLTYSFSACKSSTSDTSHCEGICLKDTLKFIKADNPLLPHVYISTANCVADTLIWSYDNMGVNRKLGFADVIGDTIHFDKDHISCYIKDTTYACLKFNDCSTGRGWIVKVPYSRQEKLSVKSSALNSFDPKFAIEDGLIAYTDRGNIFAEDLASGKTAMMTFGTRLEIDYNTIHDLIDSVSVTQNKIWAKVKIGDNWVVKEKDVEFK